MFCAPAGAQSSIYLKSRIIDTRLASPRSLSAPQRKQRVRHTAPRTRVHRLMQFGAAPDRALVTRLENRGIRVLQYVHSNGLLASMNDAAEAESAGAVWVGELEPADKLSPLVRGVGALRWVLIEFHADVAPGEMRPLISQLGLTWKDNPDVSPRQVLALADDSGIAALAARDEVEYIFPASDALINGRPAIACDGAITFQGRAGQFISRVGDGWDGPGRGAATIGYWFGKLTPQLPADTVANEFARALAEWTRYADLTFTPAPAAAAARVINILWAQRDHGDGFPFDGPGGALAHTFYPAPPNAEPVAGDMHLDEDESWSLGADVDVYSVALHEIGHALGLGHSDRPGAVMYPYYRRATTLTGDDIAALLDLYAPRTSGEAPRDPPVTPAEPPVTPPAPPAEPPVTPANPGPPAADETPPSVVITSPGASIVLAEASSITLRGTAADNVGVTAVNWVTAAGASGAAVGTAGWTAPGIPLLVGFNTITIRASDAAGNVGWRVISVTRR